MIVMRKLVTHAMRYILPVVLVAVIGILPHFLTVLRAYADSVDLYWYPVAGSGTGNWNGGGHWATAADGTGLGHADPTQTNKTFFTSTSFTGAGQTVTINSTAACLDMDWTGATNTPTLAINATINVYGSVTFIAGMVHTPSSSLLVFNGVGNFTTTQTFPHPVKVQNGIGSITLVDTLNIGTNTLSIDTAAINTNGQTVTAGLFRTLGVGGQTLTMGSSTINVTSWTMDNLTVTANTATVNISGTGALSGGAVNYNGASFNLNGTAHTVSGAFTVGQFNLPSGTTQTITFTDATTYTATAFTLSGSVGHVHTLQGSGVGGWTLSQAAGTVNADYISVSRSTAGGGATFNAVGASVNGGNNVGWNFPLTVTTQASSGRTFNGTLVDMGGANDTVWFEFGTTTSYGDSTTHVAQTAPTAFTASMPSTLIPGTLYHYRAVMDNGTTTATGSDVTFVFPYNNNPSNGSSTGQAVLPVVFMGILIYGLLKYMSLEDTNAVVITVAVAVIVLLGVAFLGSLVASLNGL